MATVEVLEVLRGMGSLQLLFAFTACFGYALAQGALLGTIGRRVAWAIAAGGAAGFAASSADWPAAVMLMAIAVVAIGLVAAIVWVVSRLIGTERWRAPLPPSLEETGPATLPRDPAEPKNSGMGPIYPI